MAVTASGTLVLFLIASPVTSACVSAIEFLNGGVLLADRSVVVCSSPGCSLFGCKDECKTWQRENSCFDCPYLEFNSGNEGYKGGKQNQSLMRRDKFERMYHRMKTGLQIAVNEGEEMRFVTFTTSPKRVANKKGKIRSIKDSFDVLRLRIERATVAKDGFMGFKLTDYYSLKTDEGLGVLHVLFCGRYIPWEWLRKQWKEIHGAWNVNIQQCYSDGKSADGLVGYLLRNYLKDQPIKRMSYGWGWAWRGFCRSWENVKRVYGAMRRGQGELTSRVVHRKADRMGYSINHFISFKTMFVSKRWSAWHCVLWNHPVSTRQLRLTKLLGG